jgi:O-antigen ligase
VLSLACVALQLVPLPQTWRASISPHAAAVDAALLFEPGPGNRPLSLDPAATAEALAQAVVWLVAFWTARDALAGDGVRRIVRTVCWTGFLVSVLAIVVHPAAPELIYGIWRPSGGTKPFGPFVNRNHMGSWLLLALPATIGYLAAHVGRRASADALDARTAWTGGAVCAMFAALVVSLSRSAAVGAGAALACAAGLAVVRHGRRSRGWLILAAALGLTIVASMPVSSQLLERFDRSQRDSRGRFQIWRESISIVRDFPATGVGLGAFRMAMIVYQKSDRATFFNDAHDEYLQVAAEGGLLVGVPLLLAAFALGSSIAVRLRSDRSKGFWIRAGAVAGLTGLLVQSIWETGLTMPANDVLFAIVCAIAVGGYGSSDGRFEGGTEREGR